jgi:hypothetical protein
VDVERTIEFILETRAKHEAAQIRLDRRMDGIARIMVAGMRIVRKNHAETSTKINALIDSHLRTDAKLAGLAETQAESQRRTDARFAELAETQAESQRRTDAKFAELAESLRVTDQKFQAFMDTFGKNRNGN